MPFAWQFSYNTHERESRTIVALATRIGTGGSLTTSRMLARTHAGFHGKGSIWRGGLTFPRCGQESWSDVTLPLSLAHLSLAISLFRSGLGDDGRENLRQHSKTRRHAHPHSESHSTALTEQSTRGTELCCARVARRWASAGGVLCVELPPSSGQSVRTRDSAVATARWLFCSGAGKSESYNSTTGDG